MSACVENPSHLNATYLDRYADPNPILTSVLECHGFSCSETSRVALNRDAWRQVAAVFAPRAKDAPTERRQIAHGVALIQLLVGQQTGTATHQWTHRDKYIFPNLNDPTQLNPQMGQMMVAASRAANGPQESAMGKIIAFARVAGTVAVLTVHPHLAKP